MSNFLDRLKTEYEELVKKKIPENTKELRVKMEKLDDFLSSDKISDLSDIQHGLLISQLAVMTAYLSILATRVNDLDPKWMDTATPPGR